MPLASSRANDTPAAHPSTLQVSRLPPAKPPPSVLASIFYNFTQMFIDDDTRKRLEDIVKGIVLEREADNCTAARNLLCASFRTSTTVKKDFDSQSRIKKEQTEFLKHHCSQKKW
jgi:hypothetical protein